MIARVDIVAEARRWIGTRWTHQAACKGVGCDCIGLVAGVARALGVREADAWFSAAAYQGYGRAPDPAMLKRAVAEYLDPVYLPEARAGDILLMRFKEEPQHFALLSAREPDQIIHAWAQRRQVVETRLDAVWRSRIVGAFAYRGVT